MADKALVIDSNGRVLFPPASKLPPPKPGWVPPANPAIGPSGPYGEQGPFARPY